MKKLIACGCSWTDETYRSDIYPEMDCSWTKWPAHLAKKLDMEPINLGRSGAGNEYIFSTLQDIITRTKDKSEIGLVVAAWTECHRRDYQEVESYDSTYDISLKNKNLWRNTWVSKQVDEHGNLLYWMRKTLRYQLALQTLCERWKIPYVQFQMIHPYDNYLDGLKYYRHRKVIQLEYPGNKRVDEEKVVRVIRDMWPIINDKRYLGWPLISTWKGYTVAGGYDLSLMMDDVPNDNEFLDQSHNWELVIDKVDTHPNAKGHEWISNFIHTEMENRKLI